tara:strand:+ start:983 stop:1852 length:870 start_codon:yes stop_codon:yes gene_type:complete
MAFEFRDILPAVGAVIGFGFGGPGGAALGSGIGSLARGDEGEEALKNAALGYLGGQGASYLGDTEAGKKFISGIPMVGDFIQGGTTKSFGDLFNVFQKTSSADRLKQLQGSDEFISLKNQYETTDDPIIKNALGKRMESLVGNTLDPKDTNLLDANTLFKLGLFTVGLGSTLDQDNKGGPSYEDFKVTTDTAYEGFDKPPPIRDVAGFADGGIVALAEGGFPRKNGKIAGPGTETSDDIPAMLSDGEFVVNARTVRGLGESMGAKDDSDARERGSSFLYSLQDKYGGKA